MPAAILIIFNTVDYFTGSENKSFNIPLSDLSESIDKSISLNKNQDNKSIQKSITYETVIDFLQIIIKIYKINSKNPAETKENNHILQLLLKYNDIKCINWITGVLKHYNINDNLADTYIRYNDMHLYEPIGLHIAVICDNADVIKILTDYGADIYAEDENREPVFMLAEIMNKL